MGADPRCPGGKPAKGVCPEEGPEPLWVCAPRPRRDAWPREAACRCLWWAPGTGRPSCGPRHSVGCWLLLSEEDAPSSPLTRSHCAHLTGAAAASPGPRLTTWASGLVSAHLLCSVTCDREPEARLLGSATPESFSTSAWISSDTEVPRVTPGVRVGTHSWWPIPRSAEAPLAVSRKCLMATLF